MAQEKTFRGCVLEDNTKKSYQNKKIFTSTKRKKWNWYFNFFIFRRYISSVLEKNKLTSYFYEIKRMIDKSNKWLNNELNLYMMEWMELFTNAFILCLFKASFGIVVFCLHCLLSCLLTYTISIWLRKGDNLMDILDTCLFTYSIL